VNEAMYGTGLAHVLSIGLHPVPKTPS